MMAHFHRSLCVRLALLDGRVHVAMSNNAWKLKLPEEEWGFYYASLPPGANAFSPVRNLNRKPSEGFSLAADERGNVSACFLSGKLFTMVSHDNGETFSGYAEPALRTRISGTPWKLNGCPMTYFKAMAG